MALLVNSMLITSSWVALPVLDFGEENGRWRQLLELIPTYALENLFFLTLNSSTSFLLK